MLSGISYLKMFVITMSIRIRKISLLSETLEVPFYCFADKTQNTNEYFWLFHIIIDNFIMLLLFWTTLV